MTKICFIGLGKMGAPMAANLVKAGHSVTGFDLALPLREAASRLGITMAESADSAISGASIVITMLPAGEPVLAVTRQALSLAAPGALFIDCSTIDVDTARQVHAEAAASGALSLDAPVSGGTTGAEAGTLTLMCGGSEAAFAAARPLLLAMGRRAVHCGGAGCGQAAKICNNMILGAIMAVTSEAFVLGEQLGLSSQSLFDVVSTSSGGSFVLTRSCPVPGLVPDTASSHGYKPGFTAALMLKDLRLSQAAAASAGVATPVGAKAAEQYAALVEAGYAAEDYAAIIKLVRP
jgi:3-hydroxyisobutyrate dehydrogenase